MSDRLWLRERLTKFLRVPPKPPAADLILGDSYRQAGWTRVAAAVRAEDEDIPAWVGVDPHPDDSDQHFNAMAHRLVTGDLLMRAVLNDARATVSAAAGSPQVIAERIGVAGHSLRREYRDVPRRGR